MHQRSHISAVEPQRHPPDQQENDEERQPDRQPHRDGFDRAQLRQQDLRRQEGPAPDEDSRKKEYVRKHEGHAALAARGL